MLAGIILSLHLQMAALAQVQGEGAEGGGVAIRALDGGSTIVVNCIADLTTVSLEVSTPLLPNYRGPFRYAALVADFDDRGPRRLRWSLSGTGTWLSSPYLETFEFIRGLVLSERLTLRMESADTTPLRASFDLTGFRTAVRPVAEACSWTWY